MSDLDQITSELKKDFEKKVARLNDLMADSGEEYRLIDLGGGPVPNYRCQIVDMRSHAVKGLISMDQVDKRIKRLLRVPITSRTEIATTPRLHSEKSDLNEILFNSIQLINKMKYQLDILERG